MFHSLVVPKWRLSLGEVLCRTGVNRYAARSFGGNACRPKRSRTRSFDPWMMREDKSLLVVVVVVGCFLSSSSRTTKCSSVGRFVYNNIYCYGGRRCNRDETSTRREEKRRVKNKASQRDTRLDKTLGTQGLAPFQRRPAEATRYVSDFGS